MAGKLNSSWDGFAMTHESIARVIGISKQGVQATERLAIRKLWNKRMRKQVTREFSQRGNRVKRVRIRKAK